MRQSKLINGLLQGILTSLILLTLISATSATTVVMVNDEDLIVSSCAIIQGKVLNTETKFDQEYQRVYTYITVQVKKVFKGDITSQEIVLRQMGGQVGDLYQKIYGAPEFDIGEEVLLYLNTANDGALHVAHLFMGKFTIQHNSKGKAYVDRVINDVHQLKADDEFGITNNMELNSYLTKIEDTLVNFSYRVDEFNKINQIRPLLTIPQEYSLNTSSRNRIRANIYTFLGSGYRWFEPDTGGAVTYYINTANAPVSGGGITEFDAALSAWSSVSGCALRLQDGGVNTSKCGFVNDGTSIISFNDCRGEINDPVRCGGVLAIGGVTSASSQTITIGGMTFNRIIEGDVVFNNNFSCFLGNSANLAEVMTHEIGHSIGAGHSTDNSATMAPTAHGDGRGASLRSDDMAFAVFTYPGSSTPTPTALKITSFSPTSGPVGTSVIITGTGFSNGGVTSVNFGSTSATSVTVNSDTQLTAVVPSGATTGKISLVGTSTVTSTGSFTITIPVPQITSFSPTSGPIGTSIVITGANLSGVTAVKLGTATATFTINSGTQITMTVPTLAPNIYKISLTATGKAVLSTDSFTVPSPGITSFSPASGPIGTTVVITGTDFTGVTSVKFGKVEATSFTLNSSKKITAVVPTLIPGRYNIVLTLTGKLFSSVNQFTVPAPGITLFSPASGPIGTTVVITGTGFIGVSAVKFGTIAASFTLNSSTQITATVPSLAPNSYTIVLVLTAKPFSSTTQFTIPTPVINSFSPASGLVDSKVVLTGTGFTGVTAVKFGTTNADFIIDSDTQITATVPSSAPNSSPISLIKTVGKGVVGPNPFSVIKTPKIAKLNPPKGPIGTMVTITGTELSLVTAVAFNGTSATISRQTATSITVTVPVGATTGTVTVTNAAGTTTSSSVFTVTN